MKKTISVNGVDVGEVETTGDVDKDVEIMRDYLKAKGLHREVTTVQAMFRQALSFCRTASVLFDREFPAPTRGLSVAPFVVNSAFSIELYLKTLHQIRGTKVRGHELLKLYDQLSGDTRDMIVRIAREHRAAYQVVEEVSADVFRSFVQELNTAFVDWRYCYELGGTGMIKIQPTILVMACLDQACRRLGAT